MSRRNRTQVPDECYPVHVESLDLEGHGVGHHEGKVVFVRGGLPGEDVEVRLVRRKPRFDVGETIQVRREASVRVTPRCPHFGVCGGCATQHVEPRAQVAYKQRVLEDTLWHMARVRPMQVLPPIEGPFWGYRGRARLTVRHVAKKGGVLVGFHERGSSYVADMRECHVLPPALSDCLVPLRALVEGLSIRDRMPQIEVAVGDDRTAFVFRTLEPPTEADRTALAAFSLHHGVDIWLQPKGPDTIVPLTDQVQRPSYQLPEFGVALTFAPTEFTQVNAAINRQLIRRALNLLQPGPGDRVLDLFCGLGNFTLPLATRSVDVLGIEGSEALVARALENARSQAAALLGPVAPEDPATPGVRFAARNLFTFQADDWAALGRVDRVLIDPPRDGAQAVVQVLAAERQAGRAVPARVVYVSCNPATLARDVAILVHEGGWTLQAAGVVNMFPHTAHVESVALLTPLP